MRNATDSDSLFDDFEIDSDVASQPSANGLTSQNNGIAITISPPQYKQNSVYEITPDGLATLIQSDNDPIFVETLDIPASDEIPPLSTDEVLDLIVALNEGDEAESLDAQTKIIAALKENRIVLFSTEVVETYVKAYHDNRDVYIPALRTISQTFDGFRHLDTEVDTIVDFYKKHQEGISKIKGIGGAITFAGPLAFDKQTKHTFSALMKVAKHGFDKQAFGNHDWHRFMDVFDEEGIEIGHFVRLVNLLSSIEFKKNTENGSK